MPNWPVLVTTTNRGFVERVIEPAPKLELRLALGLICPPLKLVAAL